MHKQLQPSSMATRSSSQARLVLERSAGCIGQLSHTSTCMKRISSPPRTASLNSFIVGEVVVCRRQPLLQAAQTLGIFWLGTVLTAFLRGSLKLGVRASHSLYIVSFVTATVPLGVKAHRRLRNLILRNPRAVDDLKAALDRVQERATIMDHLTAAQRSSGSAQTADVHGERARAGAEPDAPSRRSGSTPDDLVHVTAADCASPEPSGNVAVLADQADGRGAGTGSSSLAELQPERPGGGVVDVEAAQQRDESYAPVVSVPGDASSAFTVLSNER